MLEIILIASFALLGIVVQRIVGFGLSSFLLPVLLAYLNSPVSVTVALFMGTSICVILLLTDRKSSALSWPIISRLFIASVPGLLLGSYIVTHIDKAVLEIIVGLLIIAGVLVQEFVFPKATAPLQVSRGIYVSGFLAGILNAAAAQAPPPLVLWMRTHKVTPNQIRHNLAAIFIIMNTCSITVIHFLKPASFDSKGLMIFVFLLPIVVLGNYLGKVATIKINTKQYERILFIAVIIAGVASIFLGLTTLR